ncbi:DUF4251 domain-containing protein [Formosa haliotis]|uniref:DUF4251 domain-containing protein n=1 Tax=Formosa haliotis TaxID=1555194 RepID=UPI0008244974|nr:DUF4251 domain-containing protein [Formosa haliotis]
MKKYIVVLFVICFGIHFSVAQTRSERKAAKKEKEAQEFANMKTLIDTKQYTFEGDWATTQSGKRITLIGNPNYLNIDKTKAKAELPFFGVAQSIPYGGDGGIKFDGELKNYEVSYNDKKRIVIVNFSATNGTETFDCTLRIYGPETTTLNINSTNRNTINYDGRIKPLPVKKED